MLCMPKTLYFAKKCSIGAEDNGPPYITKLNLAFGFPPPPLPTQNPDLVSCHPPTPLWAYSPFTFPPSKYNWQLGVLPPFHPLSTAPPPSPQYKNSTRHPTTLPHYLLHLSYPSLPKALSAESWRSTDSGSMGADGRSGVFLLVSVAGGECVSLCRQHTSCLRPLPSELWSPKRGRKRWGDKHTRAACSGVLRTGRSGGSYGKRALMT